MKDKLQQKQEELKSWLKKLGLSQAVFAEGLFYDINESDNKEEIEQFKERFKKAINRDTTDIKLIETYFGFLFEQNEFLKLGLVKSNFHYEDEFPDEFNLRMKKISKKITEKIISQNKENSHIAGR